MSEAHEKEIAALRTVMWSERDPEGRAFAPLADAYRRAGDFRKAAEVLREGLVRLPEFATGHLLAARLYLERGLAEEAELSLRRTLQLDEANLVARGLLIGALEARGASAEAAEARSGAGPSTTSPLDRPVEAPPWGIGALAPDEESVWDIALLAPDEEPVWDIALLAPDEEPVWDIALLAPDEEPVWDIALLAPDEEPVWDIAALAPDEEPVLEIPALPPDESTVTGGPVWDIAALAPDGIPMEPVDLAPAASPATLADMLPEEVASAPADELVADGADPLSGEPLVTRTMAELYARQGLFDRALEVYRLMGAADPEIERRIAELETQGHGPRDVSPAVAPAPAGADEDELADYAWPAAGQGVRDDVHTPFAWTADESEKAPAGPPIGGYFRRLLSWRPRNVGTQGGEVLEAGAPVRRDDPSRWFNEGDE